MRKKTGITFHSPIEPHKHIEVGQIYACEEDMHIQLRLTSKSTEEGKLEQRLLSIKKGVQFQIKAITKSIPRAVIFDATIQNIDGGSIITQEVSYPLGLFQHYFRRILQTDN